MKTKNEKLSKKQLATVVTVLFLSSIGLVTLLPAFVNLLLWPSEMAERVEELEQDNRDLRHAVTYLCSSYGEEESYPGITINVPSGIVIATTTTYKKCP